ncbi:MAG: GntR family transcriptional regulator [Chloroflexi bacterium]|nr:MAG: GntR family transcriptional regulator [Chloroflexota bacterium]
MPTLERSNPLPLYYQLKEVLKQQIHAGHLAPHTAIPSEPELVAQYHVSRATVRQALTELVHEGLLYRQHGRGTFVCEPRVQQHTVSELSSFTDELKRRGLKPGGMLFVSELVRGSQVVREQLRLTDEEQVVRLERLRTGNDEPIAYEVNYLPYPRAMSLYQRAREAGDGSLYQLMATEGLVPSIAEHSFKGDKPTEREAELLRIDPSEPGMRLSCIAFDDTGAPIEYTEAFYPSSRFEFRLTLRVMK